MTILDTPRYFTMEEMLDYFRHIIKELEEGRAAAKDLNWQAEMGDGVSVVYIRFILEQNTIKHNRRRISDK